MKITRQLYNNIKKHLVYRHQTSVATSFNISQSSVSKVERSKNYKQFRKGVCYA